MIPSACPAEDALGRYATGVLSEAEADQIDAHLSQCTACLNRLDSIACQPDRLIAALRHPPGSAVLEKGKAWSAGVPRAAEAAVGTILGGYLVLEDLGHGGMGRVYRARHPRLEQEVALKVLRPGLDSAQFRARFEAERQTLGLLDHPHIARVSDGGMTEQGQPFLVMELVRGVSITRYAADQHLDLPRRLELFIQVCEAVQHAHQKGIIHRDLKPSNILVAEYDSRPVPKVIDFGVAKASERLSSCETEVGMLIGTPEYMSPEQADLGCRDIDTRSDIYALGVLLYELLTGDTPFGRRRTRETPVYDILRSIRDVEPPPPSKKRPDSGQAAGAGPQARQWRELDWIVLRCLEKDRARRYQTAAALAEDVRRFLRDEPVLAGPPGRGYRLRKFVRRHRRGVTTAAAFMLLLLAGVVTSTWLALRAREAQAQAEIDRDTARLAQKQALESATEARSMLSFFQEHVLAAGRPEGQEGGLGREVTVRKAVDVAEPRIAAAFAGQPLSEASLRNTLGLTYIYVGEPVAAIAQLERAWELRRARLGPDHADTLTSWHDLGVACRQAGLQERALAILNDVLEKRTAQLGLDHADTLSTVNELSEACRNIGKLEQAFDLARQAFEGRQAKLGPDHVDTLVSLVGLGAAHEALGRMKEALELFEKATDGLTNRVGKEHPYTLSAMNNLGLAYRTAGQGDRAAAIFSKALEIQTTVLGPEHLHALASMNNLGLSLMDRGQVKKAIPLFEQVLKVRQAKLTADHPVTLQTMNNLAAAYQSAGQLERAVPLYEQVVHSVLGPDHTITLNAMNNLAALHFVSGKIDRAITIHTEALARRRATVGSDHPDTLTSMNNLGYCYWKAQKCDVAIPLLQECLAGRTAKFGVDHPQSLNALITLAAVCRDGGRAEQALALLGPALDDRQARLGPDHADTLRVRKSLASVQAEVGYKLLQKQQYACAEPLLRAALQTRAKEPDAWTTFSTRALLGSALAGQQQYAEAEPLLRQGYEGMKAREAQIPAAAKGRLAESLRALVELYEGWAKPEDAARWRKLLTGSARDR